MITVGSPEAKAVRGRRPHSPDNADQDAEFPLRCGRSLVRVTSGSFFPSAAARALHPYRALSVEVQGRNSAAVQQEGHPTQSGSGRIRVILLLFLREKSALRATASEREQGYRPHCALAGVVWEAARQDARGCDRDAAPAPAQPMSS